MSNSSVTLFVRTFSACFRRYMAYVVARPLPNKAIIYYHHYKSYWQMRRLLPSTGQQKLSSELAQLSIVNSWSLFGAAIFKNVFYAMPFNIGLYTFKARLNTFTARLDIFWENQEVRYNWKADILYTGSRSNVELMYWLLYSDCTIFGVIYNGLDIEVHGLRPAIYTTTTATTICMPYRLTMYGAWSTEVSE